MIIALLLIMTGSIICSVKFFIETEKILNEQPQSRSEENASIGSLVKVSSKDGSKLIAILFLTWIASIVFIGMGILVLPFLFISVLLAPAFISMLIRVYVINDQIICLGASLMALGIILSLFLLII